MRSAYFRWNQRSHWEDSMDLQLLNSYGFFFQTRPDSDGRHGYATEMAGVRKQDDAMGFHVREADMKYCGSGPGLVDPCKGDTCHLSQEQGMIPGGTFVDGQSVQHFHQEWWPKVKPGRLVFVMEDRA